MWMMSLHLHVNQKSDYDDDDAFGIFGRSNTRHELKFQLTMVLELTGRVELTKSKHKPGFWLQQNSEICT